MEALLAFAAALLALRLAGSLAGRWRARRRLELLAWACSLFAYAVAAAALAWGASYGWGTPAFRVYYLTGGLLTAPLLGIGSLLLWGRRWAAPVGLVYVGLAVGVALAMPVTGHISGHSIPQAQDHLDFFPARFLAIVANSLGTLAVIGVALLTIRRRPRGNALIIGGVGVAAVGSTLAGLGVSGTAAFVAVAVALLYAGIVLA